MVLDGFRQEKFEGFALPKRAHLCLNLFQNTIFEVENAAAQKMPAIPKKVCGFVA